ASPAAPATRCRSSRPEPVGPIEVISPNRRERPQPVDRDRRLDNHPTMKYGPDISKVASMMGDPARANMLMALMSGMALTSKELAREAGVTPSTASTHLAQLEACGLVHGRKQGRCRYFDLADTDVAHAVEALVTVAARAGHLRARPGPRDD